MNEPEAPQFLELLYEAESISIAAPTLLECEIVILAVLGAEGQLRLRDLLDALGVEILTFGEAELAVARTAYRDFGKGRHPAALNFGDCFGYAAAVLRDEPLLFKGDDFRKTDVKAAN